MDRVCTTTIPNKFTTRQGYLLYSYNSGYNTGKHEDNYSQLLSLVERIKGENRATSDQSVSVHNRVLEDFIDNDMAKKYGLSKNKQVSTTLLQSEYSIMLKTPKPNMQAYITAVMNVIESVFVALEIDKNVSKNIYSSCVSEKLTDEWKQKLENINAEAAMDYFEDANKRLSELYTNLVY